MSDRLGRFVILADDGGNYLLEESTGNVLIASAIDAPIPSVSPPDLIDYVFEFSSEGRARHDSVLGSYFTTPFSGLNPDVLIFDRSVNSTIPLLDYWFMVSQTAPINMALWNHTNLQLVINRTQLVLGNANVLLNIPFPDTRTLSIMVSAMGQYAAGGLFGVGQLQAVPANGYITEDAADFYVAEDGSTFYVQET